MRDRSTQRKLRGVSAKHLDLDVQADVSWRVLVRLSNQLHGLERLFAKTSFGPRLALRSRNRETAEMLLTLCGVTIELHLKSIVWQFVPLYVNPSQPPETS